MANPEVTGAPLDDQTGTIHAAADPVVSGANDGLAALRAGFPRWDIFRDAFWFLLVACLKADPAVRVTADEPNELQQKIGRRQARLDHAFSTRQDALPRGGAAVRG